MRSSRKLRFAAVVLVLAAAAGFVSGFVVPTAYALPPNEVDREYYSDGSYTTLIGERILFCNGQWWSWGSTSSYVIIYTFPC